MVSKKLSETQHTALSTQHSKIMFDQYTLGIEEEFQIVDPVNRELKSHVSEILEEGKLILGEKLKPEMIQSMIEGRHGNLP